MTLDRLAVALSDRYRLERELGAGGMATVYLSEDLRHRRRVAVKVLRPELAAVIGAERFLSEITTTANLQHPHILPLFDSGEADGFLFYVMPYIEGETVRDRLTREKQLSIADAVRIAIEVAQALDYAHRHGVIHRDIKPENILLHDGSALVADFGIALAASKAGGARMTETGMSLGTPHYMSPEQAMGEREISARSDVYALGCVLYEMLVGEPPFTGPTAQAIIARVVTEEPRSLTLQRKTIPRHVEAAVEQALQKLPADRFATAAEFVAALQGRGGTVAVAAPGRGAMAGRWRPRLRDPLILGLGAVALVATAAAFRMSRRPSSPVVPQIQFVMATNDSTKPFDQFPWPAAISPNGDAVVYSAPQGTGTVFYLLKTDQLEAHPIPGTVNASQPVFSPDGAWIAFGIADLERKVRLDGGAPVTITATHGSAANGATWTTRNEIVLGAHGDFHGLTRVSAAGGEEVIVTEADSTQGALDHLWPIAFPDGNTIAFGIWSGSLASTQLAITTIGDGRVVPLGIPGIRPLAVLDEMLVYLQADGAVMAVGIDIGARKTIGRPIPLHDPVPVAPANNGNSGIYISNGGAMVTSRGGTRGRMAWIAPDGRIEPILPEARGLEMPRLSPDERRIAVVANESSSSDVWIHHRDLGTFSRLTSSGSVTSADWSADGARIVFTAGGGTQRSAVWMQDASGASPAMLLFESPLLTPLVTASADGKSLLVNSLRGSSWDINRITIGSDSGARPYVATLQDEQVPTFSPDGKWVALMSRESGRYEIYLRSYPDPSVKMQVSTAGGERPVWSPDGLRLYYQAGTALLAARLRYSPTLTLLGRDTILSSTSILIGTFNGPAYDISRTGRILGILPDANDFELVIAPNWLTEFRRRVAESNGEGR